MKLATLLFGVALVTLAGCASTSGDTHHSTARQDHLTYTKAAEQRGRSAP
jgi:hypothetical protein